MAQLDFWLELGELSQLGSAQLAILDLLASSAQLSSRNFDGQLSSFYELENEPNQRAHLAQFF